jgi:two-component system response regulator HupR/HoxA
MPVGKTRAPERRSSDRPPGVLVIARDEETRRRVAAHLEGWLRPLETTPSALHEVTPWIDASVSIAVLSGNDPMAIDELHALRELPAGERLLLLVDQDADDESVARAVEQLRPILVLPFPTLRPALRLAVERVLPSAPGKGARLQQRPASTLLGLGTAIRGVIDEVRRIAPTDMSVLILGETGTGKELLARAIHEQSERAAKPFVAVNCSALPDTLLESELFGARRGAYTGADRDRNGLFRDAEGGTLLLDEIGETSPAFQVKLLRALEEREVRPLGDSRTHHFDVRIISATHQDLDAQVETGGFRQDLLYRLNTVTLTIPPLRRRRVDIPFLAQHFAEELGEAQARRIVLDEDFLEALGHYEFPGNVRELRNAVERAIALAGPTPLVKADHLQLGPRTGGDFSPPRRGTLQERIEAVEVAAIREAQAEHADNRTRMAEALGLSRVGLRKKMQRLGIEAARK